MEKLLEMLRLLREQKGYSQEYIADKMGVSSSSVSRWETGQSGISLDQLTRYAESLESPPTFYLQNMQVVKIACLSMERSISPCLVMKPIRKY